MATIREKFFLTVVWIFLSPVLGIAGEIAGFVKLFKPAIVAVVVPVPENDKSFQGRFFINGTGFFIDNAGHIVTSAHLVEGQTTLLLMLSTDVETAVAAGTLSAPVYSQPLIPIYQSPSKTVLF